MSRRKKVQRILHRGMPRVAAQSTLLSMVKDLDSALSWRVTIEELQSTRSQAQNAFLWGVVYPTIIEAGGEALRGWQAMDLHEFFLGEMWGWETMEGFGRKRMRPVRRSSTMSKTEFSDFVSFIEARALDMGIVIPEPDMGGDI
jgi:hypothetical protein